MDRKPKPPTAPGTKANTALSPEEFFRTVVFAEENRRERERQDITAPSTSPDYWRQLFDGLDKNSLVDTNMSNGKPGPDPLSTSGTYAPVPQSTVPGPGVLTMRNSHTPEPSRMPKPPASPPGTPKAPQTPVAQGTSTALDKSLEVLKGLSPIWPDKKTGFKINVDTPLMHAIPLANDAKTTLELLRHRQPDGSALDAGTLFGHYTLGNGDPKTMPIEGLDTEGVTPEKFPGFNEKIEELRRNGGGSTDIELTKVHSTPGMQHAAIGHMTLRLKGKLKVDGEGWSFDGGLTGVPDPYDFNPQPEGVRTKAAEDATRLGEHFRGTQFDVLFSGEKPISATRNRKKH